MNGYCETSEALLHEYMSELGQVSHERLKEMREAIETAKKREKAKRKKKTA